MTDLVTIPLNAVASQTIQVPLSGYSVQLDIRQRSTGLFMDIYLDNTLMLAGVLCQNCTWIVREAYHGFPGDMAFVDTQGSEDPQYSGLNARWVLYYLEGAP